MVANQRKRAVIYARTAGRAAPDHTGSERQVTVCRRAAADLDADVAAVFADHGISGLTLDRPELSALLDALSAGKVDYVICTDEGRLARSMPLAADLLDQLQACGAQVVFANPPVTTPLAVAR